MKQTLYLDFPTDFSFRRTVASHGWCNLAPNSLDQEAWVYRTVFTAGKPLCLDISEDSGRLKIQLASTGSIDKDKILAAVGHIFRFDEDLREFYKLAKSEKEMAWIARSRSGRILRSTTVFEDLVKTICTTNCSWALTKNMTSKLVQTLGEETASGTRAFPNAQAMAKMPVDFYTNEIRAGYRSAYLKELAEKVASGKLDVESWLCSDLPTSELKKEIRKVKGCGEYAADNLLKLLGRYDGLALDSWLRGEFYKKHRAGNACDDNEIHDHYERYGKWRGLIMWCEMTKESEEQIEATK